MVTEASASYRHVHENIPKSSPTKAWRSFRWPKPVSMLELDQQRKKLQNLQRNHWNFACLCCCVYKFLRVSFSFFFSSARFPFRFSALRATAKMVGRQLTRIPASTVATHYTNTDTHTTILGSDFEKVKSCFHVVVFCCFGMVRTQLGCGEMQASGGKMHRQLHSFRDCAESGAAVGF